MLYMACGEWLRGHLFTGFPWNLPAYGWGASLSILQCMSVIGAYGLSFLTILLGAVVGRVHQARRLESACGDADALFVLCGPAARRG